MQVRRYEKGCKMDETQDDRTVGADDISTSSTRGYNDNSMDNGIFVHIHIFTVCRPPFEIFH